jgi:hypothetical protein
LPDPPPATTAAEPPAADPALAGGLEEAFRRYHDAMVAAPDKAAKRKALADLLGTTADVKAAFARYPVNADLYTWALDATREGDAEQYAADEARRGAVTGVQVVDARRAQTPVGSVVRVTPADVPVYVLRVKYEKEAGTFLLAPVLHVNGRWAWMPGLEQVAGTFRDPDEKP